MPASFLACARVIAVIAATSSVLCVSASCMPQAQSHPPILGSRHVHYHPTFTAAPGADTPARRAVDITDALNSEPQSAASEDRVPTSSVTGGSSQSVSSDFFNDGTLPTVSKHGSISGPLASGRHASAGFLRPHRRSATRSVTRAFTQAASPSSTRSHTTARTRSRTHTQTRSPVPSQQASGTLVHFGGPVIENVQVVPIFYSASLYQSELTAFYCALVTPNPYFGLLAQYRTDNPPQAIGFGTTALPFVSPTAPNSSLTDDQIREQLTAWFDAGVLPLPTAAGNNYYPIHFPPGVSIDEGSGSLSCLSWCGYHSSFVYYGQWVFYGVLPDLSASSCVCRRSRLTLENVQSVVSHELFEAVTDPGIGQAAGLATPLAWYSTVHSGEIGDICAWQMATVTLGDGRNYVVQKQWSDVANACTVA